MTILDVPVFSDKRFSKLESEIGKVWQQLLDNEMKETGEKEKQLAIEDGNVDPDGVPYIAVIVDGGWSQRSYGHRYTALSGHACIIGAKTGGLLFVGVRNKYCVVCNRPNPTEHVCFKNWTDSSPAMESDIIAEGFRLSEEMHGIRYKKMIGDGDSNAYKKVVEGVWYGRNVEKIECTNHCVKNYTKGLYKIASEKAEYSRILSQQRIKRLTAAVRGAINYNKEHKLRTQDLIQDLRNGPCHVLGDHEKCKSYYCKTAGQKDPNQVEIGVQLKAKIFSCLNSLIAKAGSLLLNCTSNRAESYTHLVTKFTGAKQINRSKRGSYNTRCYGAGMSYQLGPGWHKKAIKFATTRSPSKRMKNFAERRMKSLERQRRYAAKKENKAKRKIISAQNKKNPQQNPNYGPYAEKPELTEGNMKEQQDQLLLSLTVDKSQQEELEKSTRGVENREKWKLERMNRLTSSRFGEVCKMREDTSCRNKVKTFLYGKEVDTEPIRYGREREPIAREEYAAKNEVHVEECGLYVDLEHGFLGTTPDGLLGATGIIEIKCPSKAQDLTPEEAAKEIKGFCSKINEDGQIQLKQNHNYYYQIQGQLNITKREFCDFIIWTPKGMAVERINKDAAFWKSTMLPKLTRFYKECLLPEIVDARIVRSMEIREPKHICEAQEKQRAQKKKSMQTK